MTEFFPTTQPARAYRNAALLWTGLYVVLVFAVALASRDGVVPPGPLTYVLAAAPSLPIAGILFAFSRYLRDSDEYVRALLTRRIVVAAGLTFILSNTWGFLELFAAAPHVALYWVFVGFCVLYGAVARLVRDAR
jgi:hypothetical protein